MGCAEGSEAGGLKMRYLAVRRSVTASEREAEFESVGAGPFAIENLKRESGSDRDENLDIVVGIRDGRSRGRIDENKTSLASRHWAELSETALTPLRMPCLLKTV